MDRHVVKRNGVVVAFNRGILERSLRRAGASRELARNISKDVESGISDGDTTDRIYKKAFDILADQAKNVAMQYSLKKALFGLGPTGFPFEKFVAEIFRRKGNVVVTNAHIQGHCIRHEVDVLVTEPERIAMEVKFHNGMHTRSDVKVILYVKARFDDLTDTGSFFRKRGAVDRCILVTNTKFTKNAIAYAKCAGVSLVGWGYPYQNNLRTWIHDVDAHPITCLPSLPTSVARGLFDQGIVTCRGLLEREDVLKRISNADTVVAEAQMLCRPEMRR